MRAFRLVLPLVLAAAAATPAAAAAHRTANVLSGLSKARVLGAPAAGRVLDVGIALAHPHTARELALRRAMYDPASPRYHDFLTPAAYARRFGVAAARTDRLTRWLRAGGLRVTHVSGARDWIQARGTVAEVDRRFAIRERRYRFAGERFLANARRPLVPGGLGVATVVGLNTAQHPSLPAHPTAAAAKAALGAVKSLPAPLSGLEGTQTPSDLWSIYDQPASATGRGQSVAILGEGDERETVADLPKFAAHFGLHSPAVRVVHTEPGAYTDTSGTPEWDIDTQAALGMAPGLSSEVLYFAQHLVDPDIVTAFSAWVSDPRGPKQANASFGECEQDPLNSTFDNPALDPINVDKNPDAQAGLELGNDLQAAAEPLLRQAVMEGRTLFAATGDTGSSCAAVVVPVVGAGNGVANQVVPLPGYPAASPNVVAVGGTVIYADQTAGRPTTRTVEYAWPFTGGGQSFFIRAPGYQQGTANLNRPCLSDPDGSPSATGRLCRGIPDVAALSGDVATSGYTVYTDGAICDGCGGGTSLSSPLWAGMWARIQSASPAGAAGDGYANEVLYRLGHDQTTAQRDFFDITLGANGLYVAQPGWDYVSGFGAPEVAAIIKDVAPLVRRG